MSLPGFPVFASSRRYGEDVRKKVGALPGIGNEYVASAPEAVAVLPGTVDHEPGANVPLDSK